MVGNPTRAQEHGPGQQSYLVEDSELAEIAQDVPDQLMEYIEEFEVEVLDTILRQARTWILGEFPLTQATTLLSVYNPKKAVPTWKLAW